MVCLTCRAHPNHYYIVTRATMSCSSVDVQMRATEGTSADHPCPPVVGHSQFVTLTVQITHSSARIFVDKSARNTFTFTFTRALCSCTHSHSVLVIILSLCSLFHSFCLTPAASCSCTNPLVRNTRCTTQSSPKHVQFVSRQVHRTPLAAARSLV